MYLYIYGVPIVEQEIDEHAKKNAIELVFTVNTQNICI